MFEDRLHHDDAGVVHQSVDVPERIEGLPRQGVDGRGFDDVAGFADDLMVDYRRIRTGPRSRDRIEPEQVLSLHRATRAFLDAELARPHDGPTVVVTHHAPHPHSLPDRHAHLAWCDASDLTELIEERDPNLWVHGHVHRHADYRVGRTRVVCNARGHVEERTNFVPDLVIEAAFA